MSAAARDANAVSRRSMAIAAFSTVVEWYDFTLYLYFATTLSRVFFGTDSSSLLLTLGTFAVAYLMRPLGAVFFGQLGDRYGRRSMMLVSIGLMTTATLLTALLPTREDIGPWAGIALMGLRCVMGFAVGGEYTGVVAYLMEGAPAAKRGLVTSLAAAASEVGALLAVGAAALVVNLLPPSDLDAWGWRLPFLFGAAMALMVWIFRTAMQESPDFLRQQRERSVPRAPLAFVLKHHRAGIARGFAISALGSVTYYVGIAYVPTFVVSVNAASEAAALNLAVWAALVVILVTPVAGAASDRCGRRPVLLALCLGSALLPILLFDLMAGTSGASAWLGAAVLASVAGGVSAVGAVTTAEQFSGEGRLSGLALGATAATALFGGLTPVLAEYWVGLSGWPPLPGVMIAAVALAVLPVILRMPETAPATR
ncbi:MHS family proline/betaine transporter-like MFS transporter [Lysobacter enzymogenes]|uniref:MFS transporter n=1 Tax=Lysobacter enzymogenes TaxID=69 RepID=UPI00339401FB